MISTFPRDAGRAMRNRVRAAAVLSIGLAACGTDAAQVGPATRDSAGIRIVQNGAPAWKRGEAWRIDPAPLARVGVAEGDPHDQFTWVAGALRLSDGTLWVGDGPSSELRVFDPAGRYLRTVGRKGGGPGEFAGLAALFLLPGDTVAAHDYQGARVTFFAPSGAVARAVVLGPMDGTLPPRPLGVFGDGGMVVAPLYNPSFVPSPQPSRDSVLLARFSAAGAQTGALRRIAGEETITVMGGGMAMRPAIPFGGNTYVAVSGGRVLVGDNARYELAEHGADGRLARLVRRDPPRDPVTPGDRAAWLAERRAGLGARFREAQEEMLRGLPFPAHKAWFHALLLDPAGNAWVERNAAPGPAVPWDVFDPEGRFLGTVQVPAGLRLTQVGADFVVGVAKDEMQVPQVRVHRIVRP
jgi:6-bladed beta-propeller